LPRSGRPALDYDAESISSLCVQLLNLWVAPLRHVTLRRKIETSLDGQILHCVYGIFACMEAKSSLLLPVSDTSECRSDSRPTRRDSRGAVLFCIFRASPPISADWSLPRLAPMTHKYKGQDP
jgi:hypothetical protein